MLYTRPQLILLLIVVAAAGAGLAVGHWRARHPELAEQLERLDRTTSVTDHAPAVTDGQASGTIASPSAGPARERRRVPSSREPRSRPAKLTAPPAEATPPGPPALNEAGGGDPPPPPRVGARPAPRNAPAP